MLRWREFVAERLSSSGQPKKVEQSSASEYQLLSNESAIDDSAPADSARPATTATAAAANSKLADRPAWPAASTANAATARLLIGAEDRRGSAGHAFTPVTASDSLTRLRDPLLLDPAAETEASAADPYFLLRPFFSTAQQQQQQEPVAMATNGGSRGNDSACGSLSSLTGARKLDLCSVCGQFHEPGSTHLYDYDGQVDQDLLCKLCQKPLVEPLDTKCGHTFCTPCLKSHLAKQALCPIDKSIINFMECSQASSLVKKLLDKLQVICPNVDYCEEVLQRSSLEAHLTHRCRGAVTRCSKVAAGCTFQGPKTALQSHLLECPFRSEEDALPPELDYNADWLPREPIVSGEVSPIEIQRGCFDLGISFVGGCDTPLSCIVIQEIYIDGLVAKDGRLRPGDQILEVNGEDLMQATHCQAKRALSKLTPLCRLTVYREPGAAAPPAGIEDEDDEEACWDESPPLMLQRQPDQLLLRVSLFKQAGKRLGIKLVGKKTCPGLFILGLVPGGLAHSDGRLLRDDRILEINGVDIGDGTQEEAAAIIHSAECEVTFLVSRRLNSTPPPLTQPQRPPLQQQSPASCGLESGSAHDEEEAKEAGQEGGLDDDERPLAAGSSDEAARLEAVGDEATPPRAEAEVEPSEPTDEEEVDGGRSAAEPGSREVGDCDDRADVGAERTATAAVDEARAGGSADEAAGSAESQPPTPPPHQQQLQSLEHHPAPYLAAVESLVPRCVVLEKAPGESLGMSVAGGVGSQRGDIPVYVTNLPPEGLAARSRQIRKGDVVLGVNDASLLGLTHEEAVGLLKSQPAGPVEIRLLPGPESSSGGGNFMPSWVYWLALPPVCYLEKAVRLRRDPRTGSLGFSIVGGCDSVNGPQPIIVKSVVHGGPAHAQGQLRCGDLVIRINGVYSLASVTHSEAVSLLKLLNTDTIVLSVVSWPGTIV